MYFRSFFLFVIFVENLTAYLPVYLRTCLPMRIILPVPSCACPVSSTKLGRSVAKASSELAAQQKKKAEKVLPKFPQYTNMLATC